MSHLAQVQPASPPVPAAVQRTSDLPKFDRIVLWAKDNAPDEVARIEAHRGTVDACVRAARKMRICGQANTVARNGVACRTPSCSENSPRYGATNSRRA